MAPYACSLFFSQEVAQGIRDISGLSLVGEPKAMVVCFRGDKGVNIYKVVSDFRCLSRQSILRSTPSFYAYA